MVLELARTNLLTSSSEEGGRVLCCINVARMGMTDRRLMVLSMSVLTSNLIWSRLVCYILISTLSSTSCHSTWVMM